MADGYFWNKPVMKRKTISPINKTKSKYQIFWGKPAKKLVKKKVKEVEGKFTLEKWSYSRKHYQLILFSFSRSPALCSPSASFVCFLSWKFGRCMVPIWYRNSFTSVRVKANIFTEEPNQYRYTLYTTDALAFFISYRNGHKNGGIEGFSRELESRLFRKCTKYVGVYVEKRKNL